MRQRNASGSDLLVNDLRRVVRDGEEFDHTALVPGCVDLTPPPGPAPDEGGDAPDSGSPAGETEQPASARPGRKGTPR